MVIKPCLEVLIAKFSTILLNCKLRSIIYCIVLSGCNSKIRIFLNVPTRTEILSISKIIFFCHLRLKSQCWRLGISSLFRPNCNFKAEIFPVIHDKNYSYRIKTSSRPKLKATVAKLEHTSISKQKKL